MNEYGLILFISISLLTIIILTLWLILMIKSNKRINRLVKFVNKE